jgi:hypothetical protein
MPQVPLGIGYSGSHQHLRSTALYTFVIFYLESIVTMQRFCHKSQITSKNLISKEL